MKNYQIFIVTLLLIILLPIIAEAKSTKSKTLEWLIKLNYHKTASKLMRNEIIRQLREKEGMTFDEYLLKRYFERLMEEIK